MKLKMRDTAGNRQEEEDEKGRSSSPLVGTSVGSVLSVGDMVGTMVGNGIGWALGVIGEAVGSTVGSSEGTGVGTGEGASEPGGATTDHTVQRTVTGRTSRWRQQKEERAEQRNEQALGCGKKMLGVVERYADEMKSSTHACRLQASLDKKSAKHTRSFQRRATALRFFWGGGEVFFHGTSSDKGAWVRQVAARAAKRRPAHN